MTPDRIQRFRVQLGVFGVAPEPNDDGPYVRYADHVAALAEARQAQQDTTVAHLNETTRLVDEERRRWYAAMSGPLEVDLEGLAPEMVGKKADALRAECEALRQECAEARQARDTLQAAVEQLANDWDDGSEVRSFTPTGEPTFRFFGKRLRRLLAGTAAEAQP